MDGWLEDGYDTKQTYPHVKCGIYMVGVWSVSARSSFSGSLKNFITINLGAKPGLALPDPAGAWNRLRCHLLLPAPGPACSSDLRSVPNGCSHPRAFTQLSASLSRVPLASHSPPIADPSSALTPPYQGCVQCPPRMRLSPPGPRPQTPSCSLLTLLITFLVCFVPPP